MPQHENIRIFQCAYILTLEVYKTASNFKKEFKYDLGERLINSCHELLEIIRVVNSLPDKEKQGYFSRIDFKKESLRICLRIASDLKLISPGQLGVFNESIEEIGRQLVGWQKWASGK